MSICYIIAYIYIIHNVITLFCTRNDNCKYMRVIKIHICIHILYNIYKYIECNRYYKLNINYKYNDNNIIV